MLTYCLSLCRADLCGYIRKDLLALLRSILSTTASLRHCYLDTLRAVYITLPLRKAVKALSG